MLPKPLSLYLGPDSDLRYFSITNSTEVALIQTYRDTAERRTCPVVVLKNNNTHPEDDTDVSR